MLKNDIREKAIKKLHPKDKNPDITRLDGLHLELPDNKSEIST
ncbi:hypothetical protein OO184_01255 [Photorhabdus sp. APURE]|nr:hypothetical protein [Photorhabdus aballayi]MCW7546609.1 hypothetical protein [Photorhabdus aballayi]